MAWNTRSINSALHEAIDRSDVHSLRHLVQQIVLSANRGQDVSGLGPTVLCLVGQKDLAFKVAGYAFYARHASRHPLEIGLLGVNALRVDARHASPVVRAAVVRAAASMADDDKLAESVEEILTAAVRDTSSFVRRAASIGCSRMRNVDTAVRSLKELICDADPVVAVNAITALRDVITKQSRGSACEVVDRDLCYRLLGDVAGYPDFTRVAALKLACLYKPNWGGNDDEDGEVYRILDCLDPLLQDRDPVLVLAAMDAFMSFAVGLPESVTKDVQSRLAATCQRLAAHPDQHVVGAVLGWIEEHAATAPVALHMSSGLPLFFCKSGDCVALKHRKVGLLRRLPVDQSNVAAVASHLVSLMGDSRGDLCLAAASAVAALAKTDLHRSKCSDALAKHLRSCKATEMAATLRCSHLVDSLVPSEAFGRALKILVPVRSVAQPLGDDVAAMTAYLWALGECGHMFVDIPTTLEAFVERALERAAPTSLRLAVLLAALKCYFCRPSSSCRGVLGRTLSLALQCDDVVVQEQATAYYGLLQEDYDGCRDIVLATDSIVENL